MNPPDYNKFLAYAAQAYGTDDRLLRAVHQLENSGRTSFDVNNWDSNARAGTPSAGPFQFIKPTFSAFARQAAEANPNAWRGVKQDWRDPRAQALAAAWAFANGKGSHWATYSKAKGRVGGMKPLSASGVRSPGVTGPSQGMSGGGNKSAAIGLIFGNDPVFQMAAARGVQDAAAPVAQRGLGGGRKPFAKVAVGKDWRWLQKVAQEKFGLRNDPGDSQTTGGRHSAGSEHYDGRAIDFGDARNSRQQLNAWLAWARRQGLDAIDEGDHIHVSLPGSGI